MTALVIVLAILALILFFPVYLYVFFDGEFKLAVRVFFIKITVPLTKPDKKTKPESKGKKPTKQKTKTDGESFTKKLSDLSVVITSVKRRILRAFVIKTLDVSVTVGTDDPCSTALIFGVINSILYPLVSFAKDALIIKNESIDITADYNSEKTDVFFSVVIRTYLLKLLIALILLLTDVILKTNNKGE